MADLFSKKQHQAPFSKVPNPWRLGDVPKRFKGPHSKCGSPGNRGVGSNPTISATRKHLRSRSRRCFCVFWFFKNLL